jgi:hypothetical protein
MRKLYRLLATFGFGLGVVVIVLLVTPPVSRSTPTAISPSAQVLGIAHGAHIVPNFNYGTEIGKYNTLVGKNLALVMYFTDFGNATGDGKAFNDFLIRQIREQLPLSARPVIVISWMPQNGKLALGCNRDYPGGIPPAYIAAGACDTYIRNYARGIKLMPERIILRFAFEMSLLNAKYWPFHFNQGPGDFVAMWRHVHDIFREEGVTNVEWLWAPSFDSNPKDAWNNSNLYYPGNDYVDWVGPDGYNWWYGQNPHWAWVWYNDMFLNVSKDFACRYPKPQIVHEISGADGPGTPNKASWIQDAFQQMPSYPFLRAFLWLNDYAFDTPGQADFRVTSSTTHDGGVGAVPTAGNLYNAPVGSWTTTYKNGLAASVYKSSLPSLAASTPPATYCGNGEPAYSISPTFVILERGEQSAHKVIGMLYPTTPTLSLNLPAQITGSVTPNKLPLPWGTAQVKLFTSANTPLGLHTVTVMAGGVPLTVTVKVVESANHLYLPIMKQ